MKVKNFTTSIIAVIIVAIPLILCLIGYAVISCANKQEYMIASVTVQQEIGSDSEGHAKTKYLYLCVTDTGEEIVLENEDNIFLGKTKSSDLLLKLKQYEENGKPFIVETRSYRIGLFSMYQNIVKVSDLEEQP